MSEKVGIGIIGTGFARKVQVPAFLECENARIASIASAHLENADVTARESLAGHFTDDWRATVTHPDVDLVCITTPPTTHFEIAVAALNAGKHVLCEKPMAMTLTEATEMTRVAAKHNVLALIDHELRFLPGRRRAYELLREGKIGQIRHINASFRAPHRGDAIAPWNWWSDKRAGGGALGAIASHTIDSINWFLGAEISRVFCQLQSHVKERRDPHSGEMRAVSSDDEANLIIRIADGALTTDATGMISVSVVEYPKYRNRMEFFGTKGAIRVEACGEVFLGKADGSEWQEIETDLGRNIDGVPDTGFARGFLSFAPVIIDAILKGETKIEHAATFEDGTKVQKILDAAQLSSETGSLVELSQ